MDIPLQITFRGMRRSAAIESAVRKKAAKLERFHPHINSCRVVIELAAKHKRQGKEIAVRLGIKVPNGEIAINNEQSEDAVVAVREAFDAARRKIEDLARRQRGDVKPHARAMP